MRRSSTRVIVAALFALAGTSALHGASSDANSAHEAFIEAGRLHGAGGNFSLAEADYRNALAIETRLFGPQSAAVGETLAEIALQVSNQSRFDEAAALFQRAEPIIQASPSMGARARYASYLALNAANQRKFEDALKFAQQATAARRQAVNNAEEAAGGGGPAVPAALRGELVHSLRIEVEMALKFDDLATAQTAANEALWIISQEPGLPLWWRPELVALVADIAARSGRTVPAERGYQDALALNRKIFADTAPTARLQLKIGRFYSGQQVYPASLTAYRAAFAILEKDPAARTQVVPEQIIPYIDAAVASNANRALDAEIYRVSQISASDLADQTIARVAARRAADDPALAQLVNQSEEANRARDGARMALAAESARATDERDPAREQALDAQMRAAETRAVELATRVRTAYPAYVRLSDPGPVELAALRAQLAPGEAVLSFVTGVAASYGLLVTQGELTVRRLDVTQGGLAADIADLRSAFAPTLGQLPNFSLQSSFALYRQLLGPFESQLAAVNHLIVIPQGELSSLPFAVLVSAAPAPAQSYSDAQWLVRRMALSHAPSARALVLLRTEARRRMPAPQAFLGIGDPTFRGAAAEGPRALAALAATCSEDSRVAPELLRALAPLPDTRGEIDAVSAALGGTQDAKLLGAAASESGLRAQGLDQYRILYFATHGLLPGELRCQGEPALVLSPPDGPAAPNADGVLYANEIAGLRLNADLVVLSACNTAAAGGTRFGGGALEGLSDAFFNAGARAVLASHWQVPSAATTMLMTGVFANPTAMPARNLADALRRSQLAMIAGPQTAHPFNWAAFTLIGDGATSPGGRP